LSNNNQMKMKYWSNILIASVLLLLHSCEKKVTDIPTLSTNTVSEITTNSAKAGGTIISTGGGTIITRGVCWSTSPNPSLSDDHTSDGQGTGSYESALTNLQSNTEYYVRAYAENEAGIAYGESTSFETLLTVADMLAEGSTVGELLSSGISIEELIDAGVTVQELVDAGASIGDMLAFNVSVGDLLLSGVTVADLVNEGITLEQLVEAEATLSDLLDFGFTVQELLDLDVSVSDLVDANAKISEILNAGITVSELFDIGVPINILAIAGASLDDLLNLEYSINDLFASGVGVGYLEQNGVSEQELINLDLIGYIEYNADNYKWVRINDQVWLAENLKSTQLNDGTVIPEVSRLGDWRDLTTPGYCWYDNNMEDYKADCGALYNWYNVQTEKLCPIGWHVSTVSDWESLMDYIENNGHYDSVSESLKGSTGWIECGNDFYGFNAKAGGEREYWGDYSHFGHNGFWWTPNMDQQHNIIFYKIWDDIGQNVTEESTGLSIRCIRDQ